MAVIGCWIEVATPPIRIVALFRCSPAPRTVSTPRSVSRSRNSSAAWVVEAQLAVVGRHPFGAAHGRQGGAHLAGGGIGQAQRGPIRVRIGQGGAQLPELLAASHVRPIEGADGHQPLDDRLGQAGAGHEVADAPVQTDGSLALDDRPRRLVDALHLAHPEPDGEVTDGSAGSPSPMRSVSCSQADRFTSTGRMVWPWRRASLTRVAGE